MSHVPRPDPVPVPVRIAEAVIAAGACGHRVALYFQNFPAPERAHLWNWLAGHARGDRVAHVATAGDLTAITSRLTDLRLVLVHDPRLHTPVARTIAFTGGADWPRPAVFSAGPDPNPDDDPGGTLVVHGHPDTVRTMTEWATTNPVPPGLPANPPEVPPALAPVLEGLCRPNPLRLSRLRDVMILRGLLAGAWLLRPGRGSEGVRVRPDYERVRHLLRDPAFVPADDPGHPLAAAMVGRANAYLRSRGTGGEVPPSEITRAELVDLGDPGGDRVAELLRALLDAPDGFDAFRGVGTTRDVGRDWPTREVTRLAALLLPWSLKQVRTTFERLTREGLISARRLTNNQPYRYLLPDRLRPRHSPFWLLPTADELEPVPDRQPGCPSLARAVGRTEAQGFTE